MNIIILNALGNETLRRCIDSLLQTTATADFDLHVFRERDFRERTLNYALAQVGTKHDTLFVGDDIEFTPGWYEALMNHYLAADILGLSMLYPNSSKIQDRGYNLVALDGQILLEPCDRGLLRENIQPFGWRACDALCGCFMLVKSGVFKLVPKFREQGGNRFGEFIFASEARHKGAHVAVIDHFLHHHGHGTKSHVDKSMSSNSFRIEGPIWEMIVRDHVNEKDIRIRRRRLLDGNFKDRITSMRHRRILFYGVGTVTEFILSSVDLDSGGIAFCSGLPEEAGVVFEGQKIQFVDEVDFESYDWVIITPLHIGEKIYSEKIEPRLSKNSSTAISRIEIEQTEKQVIYEFRDIAQPKTLPGFQTLTEL